MFTRAVDGSWGALGGGANFPPTPTVTAAAGDEQVVLTVDTEVGEVVYARYRLYPDGDWSAESESLKRTGDGTITVTALTNGAKYEFAVYAKDTSLTSDWAMAIETPNETGDGAAPTDVLADNEYPRARGQWAVLWLASQEPWSYEAIKIVAQKLGRLR